MRILGFTCTSTATLQADVDYGFRCMWSSYHRCNCSAFRHCSLRVKLRRLDSWILACVLSKLGLWRFTVTLALKLDRLHSYLLAGAARFPRRQDEEDDGYFRRRSIWASKECAKHGKWSVKFAKMVVSWNDHCLRAATSSFFGTICTYLTEKYFVAQRAANPAHGSTRTGTRCNRGGVGVRYHDSVAAAKQHLVDAKVERRFLLDVDLMYGIKPYDEPSGGARAHGELLEYALSLFNA